jgi:hypothetical protein
MILVGIFSARLHGVPIERTIRVSGQYVLALLSMIVCYLEIARGVPKRVFVQALIVPCMASLLFRALYAVIVLGVSLTEVRFQIISPGIPFLIAYAVSGLVLDSTIRTSALLAFIASTVVVLLSITRTYIFSYAALSLVIGGGLRCGFRN